MSRTPRVVVVGAGHNGLVCAIRLAEAGIDVTVLEHGPRPGGAVASDQATLPSFVHDHCAGFFPMTVASPAMRRLPLERLGVEWVNPPVVLSHPFLDGGEILLERSLEATALSLEAAAPGAGEGWRRLGALTLPRFDEVVRAVLSRFPPVVPALRLAARLRREGLELARQGLASAATLGRELFGDDRPTAWLAASAMHSDLDPAVEGSGAFALFLMLAGHAHGWPFPRRGAGRITDALVARLDELGGRLRCEASVERILVRRGRAAGVALAGEGEEVAADAVVSTLTAAPLARLLPDEALPGRIMRRLRDWRYGVGAFKLDYALSGPVPWTAAGARAAGVVHLGDTLDRLRRAAQQAGRGEVPHDPAMIVGQHSLHDRSRAPEGGETLYAYSHVPPDPGLADEAIADRMEDRIEAFAPGFRELVLARAVRSPRDLARGNPSLVAGDLGGGTYALDHQLVFRPAPELVRYRSPLRGLYVAGASVHPGGAVHGVSGDGAARALIADRSRLRFWR
ncbi:MAG: NAD(P)/FAD-dependent oxidoreductase [Actinomycetota bacterium]|nr:NAD(P)/FAD-dependent oxidoreductase [Actinomycetota bacterium]